MERRAIQFDCHYCLNQVTAWQDQCGQEIPCPHCQTQLVVPSQPIDANLFDDIFESLNPDRLPGANQEVVEPKKQENVAHTDLHRLLDEAEQTATASTKRMANEQAQPGQEETVGLESINSELAEYPENVSSTTDSANPMLKIEGLEFENAGEVISLKCKICDSRIHTNSSSVGSEIECPVCFTKIQVVAPSGDRPEKRGGQFNSRDTRMSYSPKAEKMDTDDNEEIKLLPLSSEAEGEKTHATTGKLITSKPVMKPKTEKREATMPPTVAKGDPAADARREAQSGFKGSLPESRIRSVIDQQQTSPTSSASSPSKPMSRRERYEAAQRRLAGLEGPVPRKPMSRPKSESVHEEDEPEAKEGAESGKTDLRVENRVEFSVEKFKIMFASPGLTGRAGLATLLIGIGSGLMHFFNDRLATTSEPTIIERILATLTWAGMGLLPYSIGVGLLWLLCGFVFRETARGNEQVGSWQIHGFTEGKSIFLIVGFSFFVTGLPLMAIGWLYPFINPLRFVLAPLLLVPAWYHQNGLAIVGVNTFKNFGREMNEWGRFYSWSVGMAFVSFAGGILMVIPWAGVAFVSSLLGAMLIAISTIGFSAAAGAHCGWVVSGVEGSRLPEA